MKVPVREIAAAAAGLVVGAAALGAAPRFEPMPSRVYEWSAMAEEATAVGARRPFFRGETAALQELQAHVTTINPGNEPHPPHRHPNEELIVVLRGTVEVMIEGETHRVGAGSSIFLAPNDFHGLRNVGPERASYYIIQMRARP